MAWPADLNVALKEWASVCDALASGRQIILLRKGGIYESGGEFEIEHRRFLFFPTYLHQKSEMLKTNEHEALRSVAREPERIEITLAGEITNIVPMPSRAAMDALDEEHIWAGPLIDMRFNYRPENPLYLLFIQARRLGSPLTLDNTPAYAGCKSWVPLERAVNVSEAVSVMNDAQYAARRERILRRVGPV